MMARWIKFLRTTAVAGLFQAKPARVAAVLHLGDTAPANDPN